MSEAITFNNIYLNIENTIIKVYHLKMAEAAGNHGEIQVVSVMEQAFAKAVLQRNPVSLLLFYLDRQEQIHSLFAGIIAKIEVSVQGEQYHVVISAKASSILMDSQPVTASYQDITKTGEQLMDQVLKRGRYGICHLPHVSQVLEEFVIQYEETDWEFFKRLASREGLRVFPNNQDTIVNLQVGTDDPACQDIRPVDWDGLSYQVIQDFESYRYLQDNFPDHAKKWNPIRYQVFSYDLVRLGDPLIFRGKPMIVGKVQRYLTDGLLTSCYTLYHREGLWVPRLDNPKLTGVSMMGAVKNVHRNNVQVQFFNDQNANQSSYYWFPYSTMAGSADGSGWYAMPDAGERVRVFFPNEREQNGYAITCMSGRSSQRVVQQDWDLQSIQGADGEEVTFLEDGVMLSGAKGKIILRNDGRLSVQDADHIIFEAGGSVGFQAGELLKVRGGQEIVIKSGIAEVTATGSEMRIYGTQVHLNDPEES